LLLCEHICRRWQDWVGFSAAPQLAPISRALQCSQELLDLGTCLPAALARRLLVLHNAAAAPLQFVWDLGVFEEERGAISGRLAIVPATGAGCIHRYTCMAASHASTWYGNPKTGSPTQFVCFACCDQRNTFCYTKLLEYLLRQGLPPRCVHANSGVLEPGESRVCQVSLQSGLAPQVFSGEVFCYARCDESAGEQLQAGLPVPAWGGEAAAKGQVQQEGAEEAQAGWQRGSAAVDGEVEEVIAQHPER
jgi:hypothetical protein